MLHLTREQVRSVDRRALDEYHIPSIVLMENAAHAVTAEACRMLDGECCTKILILCGGGSNGGDGLAAARHLHNLGADITIGLTVDPAKYKADALINWTIVSAMKLEAAAFHADMLEGPRPMLIIDAIFGTGLKQAPREPFGKLAAAVHGSGVPILSVDLPSGMDCDTGLAPGACIAARRTVTFVAEKAGFMRPEARRYLGEVVVGDIGCPRELIQDIAANDPSNASP